MTATMTMPYAPAMLPASPRLTLADIALALLTDLAVGVAEAAVVGGDRLDIAAEIDEETVGEHIRREALVVQWLDDDGIGATHPDAESVVRAEARRYGAEWGQDDAYGWDD